MPKLYFSFVFFCFLLFSSLTVHAQGYNDFFCPTNVSENDAVHSQIGGWYKPSFHIPGQYIKALIVFAQFANDTNQNYPEWQLGQLPNYSGRIINNAVQSPYSSMSLSDYWDEMSMGNLDFIGDVYPNLVIINPESYYIQNNKYFQDCNIDVINSIDNNVNFANYDKWSLNPVTNQFDFTPDGYVDMLIIIYRTPNDAEAWFGNGDGKFGGIAMLGKTLSLQTNDGVTVFGNGDMNVLSSGITIRKGAGNNYADLLGLVNHEFGHFLFGALHTSTSGLMPGYPNSYKGSTYALSGWERERLGYSAYTVPTQDNFTITIGDMVSTGQILKIPIPGQSDSYYVVENHQRLSVYDQIMRGGTVEGGFDSTTNPGKGIYIWLVKNANNYPPEIDIKTANGNWNWSHTGTILMNTQGWPTTMPLSGRSSVNRHSGKSDRHPENDYYNYSWWEKWHDTIPLTKSISLTRNIMGLPTHAFNLDYNRLFTPWSSPSSYVNGATNIGMQVYSQSGGYITLKVYNTETSCLSLAPSKPQNLRVTRNSSYEPVLTWEPNIEPDLNSGKYRIYSAMTTGAEPTTYSLVAEINAFQSRTPVRTWIDINNTSSGGSYKLFYKISAVDNSLNESIKSDYDWIWHGDMVKQQSESKELIPYSNCLLPNYPNPFNPSTTINYSLKEKGIVEIKIYDMLGRIVSELVNEVKEPGEYNVVFDAKNLPSGIYFCNMKMNGYNSVNKMILQK